LPTSGIAGRIHGKVVKPFGPSIFETALQQQLVVVELVRNASRHRLAFWIVVQCPHPNMSPLETVLGSFDEAFAFETIDLSVQ